MGQGLAQAGTPKDREGLRGGRSPMGPHSAPACLPQLGLHPWGSGPWATMGQGPAWHCRCLQVCLTPGGGWGPAQPQAADPGGGFRPGSWVNSTRFPPWAGRTGKGCGRGAHSWGERRGWAGCVWGEPNSAGTRSATATVGRVPGPSCAPRRALDPQACRDVSRSPGLRVPQWCMRAHWGAEPIL